MSSYKQRAKAERAAAAGGEERIPIDIAAEPGAPGIKSDIRTDGTVRRIAPGYRGASDFFSEEAQRRDVTRGELLNVLGMIEYNTYESHWLRRLIRWWKGLPQVVNIRKRLRLAHAATIEDAKRILLAQAKAIKAGMAVKKGELSKEDGK